MNHYTKLERSWAGNMAKTKSKPLSLSLTQVSHLIYGTVRNLVDLKISETENGFRFFIIAECIDPEGCIEPSEEPESEDDLLEIAAAHGVVELYEFFDSIASIKNDKNEYYRAFSTIYVNKSNIADFVQSLSALDENWDENDAAVEAEEDFKSKIEGKNYVESNGTVN